MKRWLIGLMGAFFAALLLSALALFLPQAFRIGLRTANRFLPVKLEVAGYRHMPGRLSLSGIRAATPMGARLQMTGLEIEYRPLALFTGRIDLSKVTLESPHIRLRRLPDGSLDLFEPATGVEEPSEEQGADTSRSWAWLLRALRVHEILVTGASVQVQDPDGGLSLVWSSVDLEGAFSGHPLGGELHLRNALLQAKHESRAGLEMSAEGHASLADGQFRLARFRMASEEGAISLSGLWSLAEGDLQLNVGLETFPLGRLLESIDMGGVEVEGVSGNIKVEAAGDARAVLEADLRGTAWGQQARAQLSGRLADGAVRLDSLDLKSPEVSVKGEGNWEIASGRLAGNFLLDSPALEESLRPYGIRDMKIRGLHIDGGMGGTLQDPEIRFQLRLEDFFYHEPLLKGFSAEGGYDSDRGVYVTGKAKALPVLREAGGAATVGLRLNARAGECEIVAEPSLSLRGRLSFEDRQAELSFRADRLDLAFLTKGWMHPASVLSLTGKGGFQGNLDRPETWRGEAEITQASCSLPDLVIRSARPMRLIAKEGQLQGEAALEANGRPLSVRGTYPVLSRGRMKLEGQASLSLEDFLKPAQSFVPILQAWQGNLGLKVSVEGPVGKPHMRASGELSDGSVLLAPTQTSDLEQRGSMQEGKEGQTEEGVKIREILAGRFQMTLSLDGPWKAPSGSLEVRLTDGILYGVPVDEIRLEASSRDGKEWNPHVRLKSPRGELAFQGQWKTPSGSLSGEVRSSELNLADLLGSEQTPVQGRSLLQGTIAGTLGSLQVHLQARTESLVIHGVPLGDLDTSLDYGHDRLSLRCNADTGWIQASIELGDRKEFAFEGSVERFPMGPVLEAVRLAGWSGTASLSGRLSGPVSDFQRWEGRISLEHVELQSKDVPLRLSEPVLLSLEQGSITIPETSLLLAGHPIRVTGKVGRESDLSLRGTIPLEPFASLMRWVRFDTGKAETDLVLRGSVTSPSLDGTIRLVAGQVKGIGLAYPAESVEADLRISSNRFSLVSFRAKVADGEIRASGAMTLAPLAFEDVRVKLDSVPVRLSDSLAGRLQGGLLFQGNREKSLLRGKLRIMEARYEQEFDVAGVVLLPRRPKKKTVRAADPFLKNMDLDMRIRSGPDLVLRNSLAHVVFSTDLEVKGTGATPVPLGTVRVEEGRIFYSNKRFDITQGSLSFIDPTGGKPNVQLESKVEVKGDTRDYLVYLIFSGPLDRIQLELRSVPDLEREDIVFLLVTGKTRDEYYAPGSEPIGSREAAQRLLVSGIGSLIGSDVKKQTGLDTFVMERTEGKEFGMKTTVGKQVSERVEVRGVFALGSGQQVSEAKVAYLLTDWFYLVGTQRTDGSFGLDFRLIIGSR